MKKTLLKGTLNKSSDSTTSKDIYIEGIMSTPVVDLENEIIGRESYADAISIIETRKAQGQPIPIFVEHRKREFSLPVGTLEEAREVENGLWFRAKIVGGPDGSYLDTVQRLIKAGALYGCSIGGDALKSQMMYDSTKQVNIRKITKMDLRELSLTGLPVNQGSSFKIAKSLSGKDNSEESIWQREVSSLYKSLDKIIDNQINSNDKNIKIQKSLDSLDGISKALENSIEKGEEIEDANILDKIKGALTDLADLLGIQDLMEPSEGEGPKDIEEENMEDVKEKEEMLPEEDLEEPEEENEESEEESEEDIEEPEESLPEEDVEGSENEEEDIEEEPEEENEESEEEKSFENNEDESEEEEGAPEEESEENSEPEEEAGEEIMSDNVEDIELKLDKIIQLLSKTKTKEKDTKMKEKSIGGDTMLEQEKKSIEKAQATSPTGSKAVESNHPHEGDQVGTGKENFDISVATNPDGSHVEVSQKDGEKDSSNKMGNNNIAHADSPEGNIAMASNHPSSVFKCSNKKCGKEFAKSENWDPNFCSICGSELDKYVFATEEQIQVLKDLEILQDMPADNTGYAVSEYHGESGSYIEDKMKEVTNKEGNDFSEQNTNTVQVGGDEVENYGHDGHDTDEDGNFKNFLRGADNVYANKYQEGGKVYNGPEGKVESKPYVGYTMKSEKVDGEVELDQETKTKLEKSLIDGLLQHTSKLMTEGNRELIEKINNVEKTVQELQSQPVRKSIKTSDEIKKSQQDKEKQADQTWAKAFGFGM